MYVVSHSSVFVDFIDCLQTRELSAVAEELACYSVGYVSGLARETYCLAAVHNKKTILLYVSHLNLLSNSSNPLKQCDLVQKSFSIV